ncbi:serine/threonine protein kinase [Pyxidicoccus fallax]|uniref:serine/threonine protein kinase n=1 Tax=Pyxidicoccus fallax TaxID=394095 RepID=UPI0031B63393
MSDLRPKRFGKYELQERLGSGGMAVVYRALYTAAPGVTKPVVIKRVLSTYAEEPAFAQMFLNEARISVGLSHGNIVQVFDFGEVDGEYFLAMELVDGHTLGRVLRAAKAKGLACIPAPLAVGIALEMCRGLHHAHTRLDARGEPLGVVHRDLSPDNVLLSYEGEVKLTDFGIAKARLAGRPETEVGIVKGKYLYFSPEQARGEVLDARSDVYTVGTVLYQMLCGQRPVDGSSEWEVMRRISEGELTPALSLNPTLDSDLQGILQLALGTSRDKRYLSAEALQQALSDWMGFRAPRFPANARKHFMSWLFQEELTAMKRAPTIPSDFLAQLQSWRGRSAAPAPASRGMTTPMSPPRAFPLGRPALGAGNAAAPTAETPPRASMRSRFRARLLRRSAVVKGVLAALVVTVLGIVGTTAFWVSHAGAHRVATASPAPAPGTTATAGGSAPAQPPTMTPARAEPSVSAATSAGLQARLVVGDASSTQPRITTASGQMGMIDGAPTSAPPTGTGSAHVAPATGESSTHLAGTESAHAAPAAGEPSTAPTSAEDETRLAMENGLYWLSRADDNRALGWFQQCLRHDRSSARCHLELARIYARRGAIRDAMKHFTHHLALEHEGPSAEEARRYLKLYAGSDPR